jgi:hypothetical protein
MFFSREIVTRKEVGKEGGGRHRGELSTFFLGGENDEKEIIAIRFWVYVIKITLDKLKK